MESSYSKKHVSEGESRFWGFLGKLSSSGLSIIGGLYVIGYIIVNGYQTKSMHYSSNALQLKHITAGALYALLTLFELLIMSWSVANGVNDWQAWRENGPSSNRRPRRPTIAFLWIWGQALFIGTILLAFLFGLIGVAVLPGNGGLQSGWRYFLPWTAVNLFVSLLLGGALHKGYGEQFDGSFGQTRRVEKSAGSPEKVSREEDRATIRARRHEFIGGGLEKILVPVGLTLCGFYSLTSFQAVYGRLNPDYGGGALYRIALSMDADSKLPAEIRGTLQAPDSCLLLVDRDDKFIHLVQVNKAGGKRLFQLEASAVAALEVLNAEPMHPDDAAYFLQNTSSQKNH
jgi:hypothetical protein